MYRNGLIGPSGARPVPPLTLGAQCTEPCWDTAGTRLKIIIIIVFENYSFLKHNYNCRGGSGGGSPPDISRK